jgi:hypothetical protein
LLLRVVQVTITTHITAGDGNTYQVSATYDQDAEMPENADLAVREFGEGEKEDYVKQSAEILDTDAEDFLFARVFDISLLDPETGGECQPASGVKVSISLLDTDVSAADELSLLYMDETITVNGSVITLKVPAVFTSIQNGFNAAQGTLYSRSVDVEGKTVYTGYAADSTPTPG